MAAVPLEKEIVTVPVDGAVPVSAASSEKSALPSMPSNSSFDVVSDLYHSFHQRRAALGLRNPGSFENIAAETQRSVFLTNQMFSGLRAELNKSLSLNPLFQISHAFSTGSQILSPYTFLAIYGTNKLLCQGQIDSDTSFSGRFNFAASPRLSLKHSVQLQAAGPMSPGGAQVSIEQDYTGDDFTASLKSINPSILEGGLTGLFLGSYLQSVTPRLSLGIEGLVQKTGGGMPMESVLTYGMRYKANDWIASAQLLARGGLQATYWKRLTDKVEAGMDVNVQPPDPTSLNALMGDSKAQSSATFGAKYEFARSIFRAQIDSQGKVGCLLEKVVAPAVRVTFAGEMDHSKNAAKLGLAVSIEASGEEAMRMQETVTPASPPF
ncbi:translocase of outer mitochondrial membrane complex, subunit TOM41 [Piedraia hortae CBS 480.64]|uniref:Translocase of outer mitochondrial membrane complex, subunit TOM41 n=1 Tax=Piedraia hortae CBS 480.64 TaxID=1314780 RepID=A0A6A7BZ54_9PEZI|nr:translocase of outer mitochondrial membrane complex, subunit TOM41 [Piedraia hortae CBS 480.64]